MYGNTDLVVTYQCSHPGHNKVNLGPAQEKWLLSRGQWPRCPLGEELATVYRGAHLGCDTDLGRWYLGPDSPSDIL